MKRFAPLLLGAALISSLAVCGGSGIALRAYAFVKRELPLYMTLRSQFVFFDYAEPRVFFFADYLAIMVLFAAVGYVAERF